MVSWNRINQLMSLGDVFDGFVGEFSANIKLWQDCTSSKDFAEFRRTLSQISQPRVPQRCTKDYKSVVWCCIVFFTWFYMIQWQVSGTGSLWQRHACRCRVAKQLQAVPWLPQASHVWSLQHWFHLCLIFIWKMEGYNKQHHATSIPLFPVRKCSPIQRALLLFALRPDSTVGALMTVVQEFAPVSNLLA